MRYVHAAVAWLSCCKHADHLITCAGDLVYSHLVYSQVCERACFYMMNASTNQLPNEWKNFALECTLPHEHGLSAADVNMNSCFVSCSFGRREEDQYLKQESDWHGDYLELLSKIENFEPELPDSTNEQRPC